MTSHLTCPSPSNPVDRFRNFLVVVSCFGLGVVVVVVVVVGGFFGGGGGGRDGGAGRVHS